MKTIYFCLALALLACKTPEPVEPPPGTGELGCAAFADTVETDDKLISIDSAGDVCGKLAPFDIDTIEFTNTVQGVGINLALELVTGPDFGLCLEDLLSTDVEFLTIDFISCERAQVKTFNPGETLALQLGGAEIEYFLRVQPLFTAVRP